MFVEGRRVVRTRGRGGEEGKNEMDLLLSKLPEPGTMMLDAIIEGKK